MIRDATPGDFDAALPLLLAAHKQTDYRTIVPDRMHMERMWIAFCVQDGCFSKVVERNGEIVGAMFGMITPGTFGGRIAQDGFTYSKRDTHKLIRAFIAWAQERRADAVQITALCGNERYHRLIERTGLICNGRQYTRVFS